MQAYYFKETIADITKFRDVIKQNIYCKVANLKASYALTQGNEKFDNFNDLNFKPIVEGRSWTTKLWQTAVFKFEGIVPKVCKGQDVVAVIDIGGEGLVYLENGDILCGITSCKTEFDARGGEATKRIVEFSKSEKVKGEERVCFFVDASSNDLFGNFKCGEIVSANLSVRNNLLRKLYYDYLTLFALAKNLSENNAQKYAIIQALSTAISILCKGFDDINIKNAIDVLSKELQRKNGDYPLTIFAQGNGHLDLAWLWQIKETKRKNARTIATALKNLKKYPNYKFCYSQPQLFDWLKQDYPKLYQEVKKAVNDNRIEIACPMWVESDVNLISGESLARQLHYGTQFYLEEFGYYPEIMWLPDVFGFSPILPNVLNACDITKFFTIKLFWNKLNQPNKHTFLWRGTNGSSVLAHFAPTGFYNSKTDADSIFDLVDKFTEKGVVDSALLLYGISDGGGGPSTEHIEVLNRESDLLGLPKIKQAFAKDLFEKLEKQKHILKTHEGELYLEKHQGTLTSVSKVKKCNRFCEIMLQSVEFLAAYAMLCGYEYPQQQLDEIWKKVLLFQFHDILPGSAIDEVYQDALPEYEKIAQRINKLIDLQLNTIEVSESNKKAMLAKGLQDKEIEDFSVVNTSPFSRDEFIKVDNKWYNVQGLPFSTMSVWKREPYCDVSIDDNVMENSKIRVEFDNCGQICSIKTKNNQREVLCGNSNRFVMYNDFGDAWDMSMNFKEHSMGEFELHSVKVYKDGFFAVREQVLKFGQTRLHQKIFMNSNDGDIKFETKVDFKEVNRFMRSEFCFNVATDRYICDVPFGVYQREIQKNNCYQYAKYESATHKFVSLCQPDFCVTLTNDCKYGVSAQRSSNQQGVDLGLSLIRQNSFPSKKIDVCEHEFSYALSVVEGDFISSNAKKFSYNFNYPLIVSRRKVHIFAPITYDENAIIVESIKKSYQSNNLAMRIYEPYGRNVKTKIGFNDKMVDIYECNMLERKQNLINTNVQDIVVDFKPFEIKTFIVEFKQK